MCYKWTQIFIYFHVAHTHMRCFMRKPKAPKKREKIVIIIGRNYLCMKIMTWEGRKIISLRIEMLLPPLMLMLWQKFSRSHARLSIYNFMIILLLLLYIFKYHCHTAAVVVIVRLVEDEEMTFKTSSTAIREREQWEKKVSRYFKLFMMSPSAAMSLFYIHPLLSLSSSSSSSFMSTRIFILSSFLLYVDGNLVMIDMHRNWKIINFVCVFCFLSSVDSHHLQHHHSSSSFLFSSLNYENIFLSIYFEYENQDQKLSINR